MQVDRLLRELGAGGSNPLTPTNKIGVFPSGSAASTIALMRHNSSETRQFPPKRDTTLAHWVAPVFSRFAWDIMERTTQ